MSEPGKEFKGWYVSADLGEAIQKSTGLNSRRGQITGRLIFGLVVVTLGVLWTLDNLDILESEPILRWWPLLVLGFGLSRLFGIFSRRQVVAGAVFSIVGFVLLLKELEVVDIGIWELWPLVLIVIGAGLVFRSMRGPGEPAGEPSGDRFNQVNSFAMWAGSTIKNESQDFRGGELSAVMGGVELDLRGARTTTPQVAIDTFAWWGGIDIRVPNDWRVVSEVTPVMGAFEDNSKPTDGPVATTLVIRGMVIMGGIEIKN